MACPTCDHTMQKINDSPYLFWCPRCGTIRFGENSHGVHETIEAPMLIRRCREFEANLTPLTRPQWQSLGIPEAIHTPEERR